MHAVPTLSTYRARICTTDVQASLHGTATRRPDKGDGLPKVCRQQSSKCSAYFGHFGGEIEKCGCLV